MLMQIPLNILHDYIGAIVMGGLSIDLLRRNHRKPNSTTLHFGLATACMALATIAFGFPALLTHDTYRLSIGTFVGDLFATAAMLFLWFISIRAFLATRPRLSQIANVLVVLLTVACIAEGIHRNLTPPYGTSVIVHDGGQLALVYTDSLLYKILNPIDSLALVLISIYFFRQASIPTEKSQRLRLKSVSIGFIFGALAFLITPTLPLNQQLPFTAIMLGIGFLTIAIAGIMSIWLMPKER